jgi:hypothetical protein
MQTCVTDLFNGAGQFLSRVLHLILATCAE